MKLEGALEQNENECESREPERAGGESTMMCVKPDRAECVSHEPERVRGTSTMICVEPDRASA